MFLRRQLLTLSIVALLILAAAIWIGTRSQKSERSKAVGTKVLPALAGKLNDVDELRIVKGGDKAAVTLKRSGPAEQKDSWTVLDRGGYPADFTKVRELLIKLSQLEIVEEKTSNPQSYPALGVEDLRDEKAGGKRIDLGGLTPPMALIVGKSAASNGNYVRVSGTERSVLAKPQLFVSDEVNVWLNRSLLDFPEERVQEIRLSNIAATETVSAPDSSKDKAKKPASRSSYVVTREHRDQKDFTVPNLPRGKKLTSPGAAGTAAAALANLGFDDVRSLSKEEDWSRNPEVSTAEYRLFDGTVIEVHGYTVKQDKTDKDSFGGNDKHWVRFAVRFDESQNARFKPKTDPGKGAAAPAGNLPAIADKNTASPTDANPEKSAAAVRDEARKLNERVQNWVYEIPGYKHENLFKPLDALLEK